MLGSRTEHEAKSNKCKRVETIQSRLYNQNEVKSKIKNRRNLRKFANMWKLSNTLLNNQYIKEKKSQGILENTLRQIQ